MPRVSIAAGSSAAAAAGAEIADGGGNAVDAAIAAALVMMCTDPGVIALSAGAFITIWGGDAAKPITIDAYAAMPGRGMDDRRRRALRSFEVNMGYGGGTSTVVGPASVATPGAVAGFGSANSRYGRIDWSKLVQPAIRSTENGFPLSEAAAEYLAYAHEVIFGWDEASHAALHHDDGRHLVAGETVHVADLTHSLEILAEEGPDSMYRGTLAQHIAEAMATGGGRVTATDLAEYSPIDRDPIVVDVGKWRFATNPAPAVGGAAMAAQLILMEQCLDGGWDDRSVATLAEIQRAVMTYRRDQYEPAIDRAAAAESLLRGAGLGDPRRLLSSPSTIHVSAVDSTGMGCSVTASAGYGSGMIVPGTGIWMNNCLGETELIPGGIDTLEPGQRLSSNMAPTVGRRDDGAVLAVGTPGASRITTALSSTLYNFAVLGMSLTEAIEHPRLHVEVSDDACVASMEPGLPELDDPAVSTKRFPDRSMFFGGVCAAFWERDAGMFTAADSRRSGGTARGGDVD